MVGSPTTMPQRWPRRDGALGNTAGVAPSFARNNSLREVKAAVASGASTLLLL